MTEKTNTYAVRLPVETIEELKKRLENQGITARELLTEYAKGGVNTKKSEDTEKRTEGYSVNAPEAVMKDILNMARLFGMNETEFFEALADAMNAGRVAVEGGKIVGVPELELGAYFDKCHELNLKPQETLDKLTRAMR